MEKGIFALDAQMLVSVGIQLFNASVLCVALTWLLYKPVRNFLRKRADGIRAQLDKARDDMAMAEQLRALYEGKLEEVEQERAGILEAANKLAAEKRGQLLEETHWDIAALQRQAEAGIQLQYERADEEIYARTVALASAMAGKFVAQSLDEGDSARLFDETMRELEGMVWHS